MQNITSYLGEAHVTSDQFRGIIESIVGDGTYIANLDEQLEPELSANNTLKIRSGVLIHHGHVMRVPPGTYDTVTYINGSQGMKRIDLVVARYEKNSETKKEPTRWVVIQGTPDASSPVAPDYNEGNMQDGDLIDDCPVFEIHFDGINVTEVKKLVEVTKNIDDLRKGYDELYSAMTNISGYSKSERKIGIWINGAPLYEKTVEFTNINIQNGVVLQHGISGINVVHDISAVFMDGTVCNPFPIVDERGILLQIMANHSILKFVGNVSYSATTSRTVRATLRYTKMF